MIKLNKHIEINYLESNQFPGNIEFSGISDASRLEFKNPGIFLLFYRRELIYIGYSNNNLNIITERVLRQIATITLREHRVQFTEAALNCLQNCDTFNSDFNINRPVIGNNDLVTSVNRVLYAAEHWDEFKNFNTETLNRFEMIWYPNPDLKGCNSIEELCKKLKGYYKPRCNKEYTSPVIGY
jgi:hypothetical protein